MQDTAALLEAYTDWYGRGEMPPSPEDVIDYMPLLAGGDHARHEGLDTVDHAEDIDTVHPFPVVVGCLPYIG